MTAASIPPPRQRLPGSLTTLEVMREALLDGVEPVTPLCLPLAKAIGAVLAAVPISQLASIDTALRDGWACRAIDLAGASSYAPVVPVQTPVRVNVGDPMPEGCDCVIAFDAAEPFGSMLQVSGESFPGANMRRAGEEFPKGWSQALVGRRLSPLDVALLAASGVTQVEVRRPRVLLCDEHPGVTCELVAGLLRGQGAEVVLRAGAPALAEGFDALVTIGGTGEGAADQTIDAMLKMGFSAQYSVSLIPGATTATGRLSGRPATCLAGRPEQALAGFLALLRPLLLRLTSGTLPPAVEAPAARKIASAVGLAELVLLRLEAGQFHPLATGDIPLHRFAEATHWCILPGASEGIAAGAMVAAEPLLDLF